MADTAQRYGALTSIFSITGLVLVLIASLRCKFIKFTDTSGTSDPIDLHFGIWYYTYWSIVKSTDGLFLFESCHWYPDSIELDGSWKAARAFSVLAFISAIFVLFWTCAKACADVPRSTIPAWEAPVYLLTATFTGLTLLLLNSNACNENAMVRLQDAALTNISFPDTCSMASGAKLALSSTVFFAAAAAMSLLGHRAEEVEFFRGLDEPLNPSIL